MFFFWEFYKRFPKGNFVEQQLTAAFVITIYLLQSQPKIRKIFNVSIPFPLNTGK